MNNNRVEEEHTEVPPFEGLKPAPKRRWQGFRLGRFAVGPRSEKTEATSWAGDDVEVAMDTPGRPINFIAGTIEGRQGMPPGGRDLDSYENDLMFDRNELVGKRVLDLGAGAEVRFATGLRAAGIDTEVVELSPDFYDQRYLNRARSVYDGEVVAGFGQSLPFDDNYFDRVFAFHVLEHITPEDCKEVIKETSRVLKGGGAATFGPLIEEPGFWALHGIVWDNEQFTGELDDLGVEIERVIIPEDIKPPIKTRNQHGHSVQIQSYNLLLKKKLNLA